MGNSELPAAGWYPAAHANGEARWWDGTRWSDGDAAATPVTDTDADGTMMDADGTATAVHGTATAVHGTATAVYGTAAAAHGTAAAAHVTGTSTGGTRRADGV